MQPAWTQAPLFASLTPSQQAQLERLAVTRKLEPGETLFFEEDACTGFFVLVAGAIQLTRASDQPGAHPTLAVILPVQSFAEAAMFGARLFPPPPRPCSHPR